MIEVKGVTKSFDDFTALDNVTCNIAEGCIYGMVGSNGAGKSTLLQLMTGLLGNYTGSITIENMPVVKKNYNKILKLRKTLSNLVTHQVNNHLSTDVKKILKHNNI